MRPPRARLSPQAIAVLADQARKRVTQPSALRTRAARLRVQRTAVTFPTPGWGGVVTHVNGLPIDADAILAAIACGKDAVLWSPPHNGYGRIKEGD